MPLFVKVVGFVTKKAAVNNRFKIIIWKFTFLRYFLLKTLSFISAPGTGIYIK